MILSGNEIKSLGLLIGAQYENYQAQGCDIRLDKAYHVVSKPFGEKILDEDYKELYMKDGCYNIPNMSSILFKIRETVDLTVRGNRHINAYVLPKSSLTRRGIIVHSAWWDAGYKGSGYVLVRTSVMPLKIKPGQAFAQMIFMEGNPSDTVYNGQYQGENTGRA